MKILHNIGTTEVPQARGNYNTREEIENCGDFITFDGVYQNVYLNRDILKDRPVIYFIVGNLIGGDNSFDKGMPPEKYCTLQEIGELVKGGGKLGWHTYTHPDLTQIPLEEARKEMTPPFPVEDFAYPYGNFNEDLMQIAKELGYKRAWSTTQGNNNPYSLRRDYL